MSQVQLKRQRWQRRKQGIRKRVIGTPDRPRLTVFRSLRHTYAQLIDDLSGKTIVAANSMQLDGGAGGNKGSATQVGKALAEKAIAAGVKDVAFDRNGYRYHGRVAALADAAREAGLKF
jgi:large subunit ribosomal protein L18